MLSLARRSVAGGCCEVVLADVSDRILESPFSVHCTECHHLLPFLFEITNFVPALATASVCSQAILAEPLSSVCAMCHPPLSFVEF